MGSANPLLEERPLPAFGRILPEHACPAIESILDENRDLIKNLNPDSPDEASLLHPLETAESRLQEAFSPIQHLRAVCDSPEWREAYQACLQKITEYSTEILHNKDLYGYYLNLREGEKWLGLSAPRQKEVILSLRNYRLGGVHLPKEKKKRFAEIEQELAVCCARFTDNVTDATGAWSLLLAEDTRLEGMPAPYREMLRADAEAHGLDGWRISLMPPSVQAILTHANDRDLRHEVYVAYTTRASDQGPHAGKYDNTGLIEQILSLRHEQAQLLDFPTIADHALATRMAETPSQVLDFLHDLIERAREQAKNEWEELQEFARNELGLNDMQRWDQAWVREHLRISRYGLREAELKPFFAADTTIQGMLDLAADLFQLEISRRDDVETWHQDVRFYEIRDADGELLGQFYLDPYARPHKHGGAWMGTCANRRRRETGTQPAVAYLTCNGSPPTADTPALFGHADVVTLFHEFGHGLHHMLTRVDCAGVSGIEGVEWDAVEWPSQWMENWCWEPEVLNRFARHYQSGQLLPAETAGRLRDSRIFNAGLDLMRQLEFALFDFRLHLEYRPERGARAEELLAEVRREIGVMETPEFVRAAHSFEHIFSGGYTAGYYSYKWAEVLSGDTYAAFQEEGLFNKETAKRFADCVLSAGGVRPAAEMFRAFRGREPNPDALLRQMGLAA
ncbi:MAG: M3 family metallopeptidase [Gammaproteobacteria bacterium]|nr:M3 family metallopeptidase [Gammaproteobacteria bacterium]